MALYNFQNFKEPPIPAELMNRLDVLVSNIFDSAASKTAARVALTANGAEPLEVNLGGTGVTTIAALANNVLVLFWPRTAAEIANAIFPVNVYYPEFHLFRYMTDPERLDYQSGSFSLNLFSPMQNCISAASGQECYFPKGSGKTLSTLQLGVQTGINGAGELTRINHFGCNGIQINGSGCRIRNLFMECWSAGGAADPKTFDNIVINGTSGSHFFRTVLESLYLQGADRAVHAKYSEYGVYYNVHTAVCNVGLRYFGQCVNNVITGGCDIQTAGGGSTVCIQLAKDGSTFGEGLFISNTIMGAANNAITTDSWLLCALDPSVLVDNITGKAFVFTSMASFKCSAGWVYSADTCMHLLDSGGLVNTDIEVIGGTWTATGASASGVIVEANNANVKLEMGTMIKSGATAGYPFLIKSASCKISKVHIINGFSNPGIRIETTAGTDYYVAGNTGDTETEFQSAPFPSVASAAALGLPDPKQGDWHVITVTGTTNVTSLTNLGTYLGRGLICLRFDNVLTFTDGGNIKLIGNTSYTTAAGAQIVGYTPDGTNFFELYRATVP